MEETKKVDTQRYSITVKMNAKREAYGEYTVRADTIEELAEESNKVKQIFLSHVL
jgi:hypothetical protein